MKSVNPTTGHVIKVYEEHSIDHCKGIVTKAEQAFQIWRRVPISERAMKMRAVAEHLRRSKTFFAQLMAEEMGKPLRQGEAEIEKCALTCEFYADQGASFLADEILSTEASKSYVHYEPLGVILAVMPWNFPFWQVFRCAAPILMAGNVVVLKHASNVCGVSSAIEGLFKLCDLPDGGFSSLFVSNENVQKLIEMPAVRAVTVTGSLRAGQSVASKAGAEVKKCVLELGGSDAYIILEDASLEQAVETCVASRLVNGGQSCVSAKRFIVVRSVLKKFEDLFVTHMKAARMGPPLQDGITLGPMARHDLRDQIHKQVTDSIRLGAQLLLGGQIPDDPGAFYPPTVLTRVVAGMPAYEEELFGPVASIINVEDEEEAIAVANNSVFGLGAAVFTADKARGERIAAQRLEAGCCFVNDYVKSDPRLPFGGIKQSGYGRELGVWGIREFTNIKTVYIK